MSSLATTRTFFLGAALGLVGMLAVSGTAIADSSLALDVDDAKLVKLAGEPSTVVVSNPMFADASIQGNKLIVIGKNTGRTKIIVLDFDGKQLANLMVKVQRAEDKVVSVFRGGAVRRTMNCEPFCDQPLIVNDDIVRYKDQNEQITAKTGHSAGEAARGSADGAQ
ncbi:MAG: pilus assembly protein N-terminal domain-containing protein [Anderseniella sp.]